MALSDAEVNDLLTEVATAKVSRSPRLRTVADVETTQAQARPDIRDALDALATLPNDAWMGGLVAPDGKPGPDFTVADVRRWLLDGTWQHDPADLPRSCAIMRWARERADRQLASPVDL
jgi:hypothetical protein